MQGVTLTKKFVCTFCSKVFSRESWYKKHMCTKKKRFQDKNNIVVFKAHRLFNYWQRRQGLLRKGKEKSLDDFLKSPFYNTFVKLSEFGVTNQIVSSYKYIDWLLAANVPQRLWYSENNLPRFREWLVENENPIDQTKATKDYIQVWCRENDMRPDEFWEKITVGHALKMITSNKISPWVLFGHEPALEGLMSRFQGEPLHILNDHVNIGYWLKKIENETTQVDLVNQCMSSNV